MAEITKPVESGKKVEITCIIDGTVEYSNGSIIRVKLNDKEGTIVVVERQTVKNLTIHHWKDEQSNNV